MTRTQPDLSIAHLRAVTCRTTIEPPGGIVSMIAAIPADAEVHCDAVPSDFTGAVRRHSTKKEDPLRPFIGPLDAFADALGDYAPSSRSVRPRSSAGSIKRLTRRLRIIVMPSEGPAIWLTNT